MLPLIGPLLTRVCVQAISMLSMVPDSDRNRHDAVVRVSVQAGFKDIESATRLAWKYMTDSGDLLKGLQARQAFLDFMELNSASHPIPR